MKRMLCISLTLVMFLTAFAMPVYAQIEGVVPQAREWTEELKYFVELCGADLDANEYTRDHEEGGIATLTCAQNNSWWVERYGYNVPEARVIFRVPEGAQSYKADFETELTAGEAYVFGESAVADKVFFPDEGPVEVQLIKQIGTIANNTLTLDASPFYVLITWFDENKAPLNEGAIEYIKVELSFPNVSSPIQLPASPVVPLPHERFDSWTTDLTDMGLDYDGETPGVWNYTFDYSIEEWEASWNQNLNREPAIEAMIFAPEDAVAYKEIRPSQVESFNPEQSNQETEGWITLEEQEFGDEKKKVIPLRYKVGEVEKIDDQYVFKTIVHDDRKLIVWKKNDGTLVDLGVEQYIQSYTMKIEHNTSFDGKEIEKKSVDMVPYNRVNAEGKIVEPVILNRDQLPEMLTGVTEAGKMTLQATFAEEDYQELYADLLAGNEQMWFRVSIPVPEGAVGVKTYTSDTANPSAHEYLENMEPYWFGGMQDDHPAAFSVTYAAVRRHDSTVIIDPCDDERWVYVSWVGENGPINVGTADEPSYVEYLNVKFTNASKDSVLLTDDAAVTADQVVLNATGWEEALLAKQPEFNNGEAVYFLNLNELAAKRDTVSGKIQDVYHSMVTQLKAPENAKKYVITATNPAEVLRSGEITNGSQYVDLPMPTVITEDGQHQLGEPWNLRQFTVEWQDAAGDKILTQHMTVTVQMASDKTWMDYMGMGWSAAASGRIGSTEDNQEVVLESTKNGVAHIKFKVDHPINDKVTLTVEAPDHDRITQYRLTSVDTMYVYLPSGEDDGWIHEAKNKLEQARTVPLGEDRKAMFTDVELATFVTQEIAVDAKDKNFTNLVYLHETYNNNLEDSRVMFVEWLDQDGNFVMGEYVYHELQRLDEKVDITKEEYKIHSDDHYGYMLGVRHYRQMVKGAEEGEGAFYLHLWLEDENGNHVQPAEGETITVCLPYPDGSDSKCDFVIEHYKDESHTAYKAETYECRADGIYVTLSHFSPFMLSWNEAAEDDPGNDGDEGDLPGGNSGSNGGGSVHYPDYDVQPDLPEERTTYSWQVICRKLNVRAGAGTQYAKIGSLSRGACVVGEMLDNGWVKFTQDDGTYGYVCGLYVTESESKDGEAPAANATVACRKLNVRSGAGTQFKRIGQLSRGEEVTIVDGCSGWYEIVYEDDYAWICAKYVGYGNKTESSVCTVKRTGRAFAMGEKALN